MNFKQVYSNAKTWTNDHSHQIFGVSAVVLGVGAGIQLVKGTVEAVRITDNLKKELNTEKLTKKQIIKAVWKCYIPSAALGTAAVVSSVGSVISSDKKIKGLNAALTTVGTSVKALTDKIDKEDYQKVKENIAKDVAKKAELPAKEAAKEASKKIERIGNKDDVPFDEDKPRMDYPKAEVERFVDALTGQEMISTESNLNAIYNRLKLRLSAEDGYLSKTDWIDAFGELPCTDSVYLGWSGWDDSSCWDDELNFVISEDKEGRACKVFYPSIDPHPNYRELI